MIAGWSFAQTVSLHGTVTDPTGAVVRKSTVTITDSSGVTRSALSDRNGNYSFAELAPGSYALQATAPDLVLPEPIRVTLWSRVQTINLTLKVQAAKQNINVEEQTGPTVSTENSSNASSIVLHGKDLESLGDSQEDLATDLQTIARNVCGPRRDTCSSGQNDQLACNWLPRRRWHCNSAQDWPTSILISL